MKIIIYSLTGLLLAVVVAMVLSAGSGQIILAYTDFTVQTSLGVFVFLLLASFTLLYFVIRVIFGLFRIPEIFRRRRKSRQHGKSEFYLTQGILALTEGNWNAAEKLFKRGARYSRMPLINYLGAARAARHQGAAERCDNYFKLAGTDSTDSAYAIGIARAELHLEQKEYTQAYTLLKQLDTDWPVKQRTKLLLLEASSGLNYWQIVLTLLNDFERKGGLSSHNIKLRQVEAYTGLLAAGGSSELAGLNAIWNDIPTKLKKEQHLLQTYVSGRLKYTDTTDCEALLKDSIKHSPEPALVRLYGLVQGKSPEKQLAFIEKLLPTHKDDSVILLTSGRLYKRASLWGRARFCLEESLKLNPAPETCYELATMFQEQGDTGNASKYFREGLVLVTAHASRTMVETIPKSRL